jgi:hypothetical protein
MAKSLPPVGTATVSHETEMAANTVGQTGPKFVVSSPVPGGTVGWPL